MSNLSVSELKSELRKLNVDFSGAVEKSDLVSLYEKATTSAAGSTNGSGSAAPSSTSSNAAAKSGQDQRPVKSGVGIEGRKVVDVYYYDVLEIEPNATPSQVKKAYFKMARVWHPDKRPDDPEANEKFKSISEAYQVLSDDNLRAAYDKKGRQSAEPEGGFSDPSEMFDALFGGGQFENYVGKLFEAPDEEEEKLLEQLAQEPREPGQPDPVRRYQLEKRQEKVDQLAAFLRDRIAPLVLGNVNEASFRSSALTEARELSEASLGHELLYSLGYCYGLESRRQGGGVTGFLAGVQSKGHTISSAFSAIKSVVNVSMQAQEMQAEQERVQNDADAVSRTQDEQAEIEEQMMESGIKAVWRVGRLEVESRVRAAVRILLTETGPYDARLVARIAAQLKAAQQHKASRAPAGESQSFFGMLKSSLRTPVANTLVDGQSVPPQSLVNGGGGRRCRPRRVAFYCTLPGVCHSRHHQR